MALAPFPQELNIFYERYHEDPPEILGGEFVGVVKTAGISTDFKSGEKVAGWIYRGGRAHDGSYAEYTICHKGRLYRLPQDTVLAWELLAAIPMSMWTAHGALNLAGGLNCRSNHGNCTVLVHGGISSVGIWIILLPKRLRAMFVATTTNEYKFNRLKAAGADYVVLEPNIEADVKRLFPKGVEIIIELVGSDRIEDMLNLTARYGTAVIMGVLNVSKRPPTGFGPFSVPPTRNPSFYTMTNGGNEDPEDDDDINHEDVEKILAECVDLVAYRTMVAEYSESLDIGFCRAK